MEEGQRLVLLDQVKDWCGDSRTKITIKPVIDLNADLSTPAYEVPDRIREQVILRDRTCVFPWCTRPARGCDIDHVIPHDHDAEAEGRPQPGPDADRQPRRPLPVPPPPQDPHRLALPDDRATACFEWTSVRTATATDATAPAPPRSTRPTHPIRPAFHARADDEPAPNPATSQVAGPPARRGWAPAPTPPEGRVDRLEPSHGVPAVAGRPVSTVYPRGRASQPADAAAPHEPRRHRAVEKHAAGVPAHPARVAPILGRSGVPSGRLP